MKILKFIDECLKLFFIFVAVSVGWQLIEIAMIGHINPNNVDTIVSIVLTLSLYKNFENQKWFEGEIFI